MTESIIFNGMRYEVTTFNTIKFGSDGGIYEVIDGPYCLPQRQLVPTLLAVIN